MRLQEDLACRPHGFKDLVAVSGEQLGTTARSKGYGTILPIWSIENNIGISS